MKYIQFNLLRLASEHAQLHCILVNSKSTNVNNLKMILPQRGHQTSGHDFITDQELPSKEDSQDDANSKQDPRSLKRGKLRRGIEDGPTKNGRRDKANVSHIT
jgi:hypothetical protein